MIIDYSFENYKRVNNRCTVYKKDIDNIKDRIINRDKKRKMDVDIIYTLSTFLSYCIRTPEFLDLEKYLPQYKLFETNYLLIKKEVIDFININNIKSFKKTGETYNNTGIGISAKDENSWRLFALKEFSSYSTEIKNFPVLKNILDKLYLDISNCFISILEPYTSIPIHTGYFKGVMRLMFAIKVPKDKENCFLWVNGIKYNWEEGKCVLWDDIYPHKVYNNTDENRIVLYMDIYRLPKSRILKKIANKGIENLFKIPKLKKQRDRYIKSTEIIIKK